MFVLRFTPNSSTWPTRRAVLPLGTEMSSTNEPTVDFCATSKIYGGDDRIISLCFVAQESAFSWVGGQLV